MALTFVPHLIPVDQGLMATNYAHTEGDLTARGRARAAAGRLRGEPFVDVVDEPPHTAHVRGTNRAHVYGTVTGSRVLTFARSTTSGRAPPARRCRT